MLTVFLVLILMLFVGVPIGFALMLASLSYVVMDGSLAYSILTQKFVYGVNNFTLLAVPFFIMAGQFMNSAGITDKLFGFCKTIIGFIPGGLAHANVVASIIFAGMSGAAVADAGGLGTIEIKAMRDDGYDEEFAAAVTGASSMIGPIIPPSIPMVIYAVASGASVAALFAGGFIPGIFMGLAMMVLIYYYAVKRKYPRHPRPTVKKAVKSFYEAIPTLITPAIILGGIFGGIFSPTESGAIAVAYSLFLGVFVYKSVRWKEIKQVFISSAYGTASVMLVVMACSMFAWILAIEQVPVAIGNFIVAIVKNNHVLFLLAVNIFLLFLGCFMEPTAAILIVMPIFLPICQQLHINLVHFGLIVLLNLMIGLLTPPVGLVLNIMADIIKKPFEKVFLVMVPFVVLLVGVLLIITYVPGLVLFLPKMLGYI
jgi:tripartite ATP-independent transporter DctM subunit